jgi:hypothetical protein
MKRVFLLMLVIAGGECSAFSARLVSEGHVAYSLGIVAGTVLMMTGLLLPLYIQKDHT